MAVDTLRVAILSHFGLDWRWFDTSCPGAPPLDMRFFSAEKTALGRIPGLNWDRLRAALQLRRALRREAFDVLVSHSPNNSYYAAAIGQRGRKGLPHLAASFNFTDVPTGFKLETMRSQFANIDRFAVFTEMERALYAGVFGVPIHRFHFVRWGVAPPIVTPGPRIIAEPYVAAIGGEARDYGTLCDAARRLPNLRFVVVARPDSFEGLVVPPNVTVMVNQPWQDTWSIAAHALTSVVPLRSGRTPNGIVTIVGGMYLGKPQIVTDSTGVHDYLADGETGLLVPAGESAAFAQAIERLRDDPATADRIGEAAKAFAEAHCTEQVAADFACRQIVELAARR